MSISDHMLWTDWREPARAEYVAKRRRLDGQLEEYERQAVRLQEKIEDTRSKIAELDAGARAFGLNEKPPEHSQDEPKPTRRRRGPGGGDPFKEVALQLLKEAHPKPLRAGVIQQEVQKRLGRDFHWKTAGMTLTRFKNDGLVERSGHDWFWKPPRGQVPETEGEAMSE